MQSTAAVSFTVEQLDALMTWAESGPLGLTIACDHGELPEVAEFWRADQALPAYSAFRRASGAVEVAEHDADQAGTCTVVADVPAAIAWIEAREAEAIGRALA